MKGEFQVKNVDENSLNSLVKTIIEIINQLASETKTIKTKDETKKMRVVSVLDNEMCKVAYNGQEFTAKTNIELKVGNSVWVLAPSGDYTNLLVLYKQEGSEQMNLTTLNDIKEKVEYIGKDIDEVYVIDCKEIIPLTEDKTDYKNIAVVGDNNSNSLFFVVSKVIDGTDISQKAITVYFLNEQKQIGLYSVQQVTSLSDEFVIFEWKLSEGACIVPGTLGFKVVISDTDYRYVTLDSKLTIINTNIALENSINFDSTLLDLCDEKINQINDILNNAKSASNNCDKQYANTKILYDELVKIEDSNAIAIQALKNNTYTMQEVDALFGNISNTTEGVNLGNYYTKPEIDRMVANCTRNSKFSIIYPQYIANTGLFIDSTEKANVISVVENSTNTALNYINLASSVCLTDVIYCNNKPIEVYTDDEGNVVLLQSDYKVNYINLGGVA